MFLSLFGYFKSIQICFLCKSIHILISVDVTDISHKSDEIMGLTFSLNGFSNLFHVKARSVYFLFFNTATICFDGSFAHWWHYFNQLHEGHLHGFQLKNVTCQSLIRGISFLNVLETISCVVPMQS